MASSNAMTSIFFSILILLIIVVGPKATEIFKPEYKNIFSTEGFKALMIFLVLYVSNKDFMLSAIIMGIFVIIMNLIREKNMKDRKQEDFESGPPVAECSTYDMKQADFVGTPFYPMSDRNNFVGEAPYYKPSLDYENIDLNNITNNVIAVSKSVESSKSFNSKF